MKATNEIELISKIKEFLNSQYFPIRDWSDIRYKETSGAPTFLAVTPVGEVKFWVATLEDLSLLIHLREDLKLRGAGTVSGSAPSNDSLWVTPSGAVVTWSGQLVAPPPAK
jgi:hypothetical protein